MRYRRQLFRFIGIVGAIVVLTGCTYYAALQQLSPAERATFRAHSKVMTSAQARAYLTRATAAERTAYLEAIGSAQRFQALEPQDREAVLAGFPRQGMSAEALRFLWGEPYYTEGYTGHFEYWYYLGSTLSLAESGNAFHELGTIVVVDLVDDRVEGWLETTDSDIEDGEDEGMLR